MRLIKKLVVVLLFCLPASGWGANLHYALNVQINTTERKISAAAHLKADADKKIDLSVRNLYNLKVDGKEVMTAANKSIRLTIPKGQEITISYEALFADEGANFIDKENIFLTGEWYPQPDILAEYALSVTLPNNFLAISESEALAVQKNGETTTLNFQFNHPLDTLHLAASTRYVLKKDRYNDIAIEAYFFKEDTHLADIYIAHAKKYLAMYEAMLTPFPYKRFAIVENIFPTGNSMPTFTLLGSRVVHLPFIVQTSLGHEILHQWFGNSVYIDFLHGNWAEGLTTYLADHHYAALENRDTAYRKQIMVDYGAYINANNAMPLSDFYARHNKAQSAIGYGKSAMLFHGLRSRYGDESFFAALQELIRENSFRKTSWHDIQRVFEKATGEKLYAYFGHWLSRKDIPRLGVENAELRIEKGQIKLNFTLLQQDDAYPLRIPVSLDANSGKSMRFVEVKDAKENISLILDELPNKVVIDENYTVMRQLASEETPPVLADIMGQEKLTVVIAAEQRSIYQPLIDALGVEHITYVAPDKIAFAQVKANSLLIAGSDNTLGDVLFGKQTLPQDGVRLKVYKNPYNETERIALVHVQNKPEAQAVQSKISHYGKYTALTFKDGQNETKTIAQTDNGILVLSRPATQALKTDKIETLDDIIPKLLASRVIYIGEKHDRFAHHMNQLHVIKKIHDAGYKLAVGMEMFQRPFQQVLNDYLSGRIDEQTFLHKTDYFKNWGYDYNLYKPIIDYLKQQNIPLVALNIEGDIISKVAREGMNSLSDKNKKQLPSSMDFSNEQYRDDLNKVFTFHEKQQQLQAFDYFLQAQTLWDEGMAETAEQFLADNPESKLVILAGNGHVRHKYGIPERLYRRNRGPFTVVVQDEEIENGIADYALLTTRLKGQKSPRLGVSVEEKDQDLVVMSVNHDSPAQKAGLQEGDVIKMFAGRSIKSLADLKLALFYSDVGEKQNIQIKRADKLLDKEINLYYF